MNNTLILTIVAVVIIGGIVYFVMSNGEETPDVTLDDQTSATSNDVTGESVTSGTSDTNESTPESSVTLAAVETGNTLTVSEASFTEPGFIVAYRVNSNNETLVIGNSRLFLPGTYVNTNIELDSIVAQGQTVVVVLHKDDGDGEFEFPESDAYLSNPDQPIISDVDVVDVSDARENAELERQVEAYLEANLVTE